MQRALQSPLLAIRMYLTLFPHVLVHVQMLSSYW